MTLIDSICRGTTLSHELIGQSRIKVHSSRSSGWGSEKLHLDENCARSGFYATPRKRRYLFHSDTTQITLSKFSSSIYRCHVCCTVPSIIRKVKIGGFELSRLIESDKLANECFDRLDDIGFLNAYADEIAARAKLFGHVVPRLTEAVEVINETLAADSASWFARLDEWSRRWHAGVRFKAAPVPASILAAPLGGLALVERAFSEWKLLPPEDLVPVSGLESLYEYWQGFADALPADETVLLVAVPPESLGFSARLVLGDIPLRWFGRKTSVRLAPSRCVEMLTTVCPQVSFSWAPCAAPVAISVAQGLLDSGVPASDAVSLAVAATK